MRNWKEICAECTDGEIEPTFCEYYGEPDGCNSPTRGEHPPVNNAAAMREALRTLRSNIYRDEYGDAHIAPDIIVEEVIDRALAEPARNCDVASDWLQDLYVHFRPPCRREMPPEWVDAIMAFCKWLVSPAEKGGEA